MTSLQPDETVLTNNRNTVCNDTVRRLQSTNCHNLWIYYNNTNHGILSEMWVIHIKFYYIINVDMHSLEHAESKTYFSVKIFILLNKINCLVSTTFTLEQKSGFKL